MNIQEGDKMVSFDGVSLFTKVHINAALEVISSLLANDESIEDRTSIPAPEVCSLVELCLHFTYLQFEGTFFEQVDGAAMRSPLSPIVANLFMEGFERKALEMASLHPKNVSEVCTCR